MKGFENRYNVYSNVCLIMIVHEWVFFLLFLFIDYTNPLKCKENTSKKII